MQRKKDGSDFEAREIREDVSEEVTLELRHTGQAKACGDADSPLRGERQVQRS